MSISTGAAGSPIAPVHPAFEPGWSTAWATGVDTSDAARQVADAYATWTSSAGTNEGHPVTFVNWYEAYAFCIWDGGFLPSEAEWNYATAGVEEQRPYPWGTTEQALDTTLAVHGCLYNGSGTCTGLVNIAPVGTAPAGNGRYGQSDLSGSVTEWHVDWSATLLVPCTDCAYLPSSATNRVRRGGSFSNGPTLPVTTSRPDRAPDYRFNGLGFRCARVP